MYLKLKIELLSLILNFSSSLPSSSPLSPDIIKHLVPEFLYFFLLWNFLSPLPLSKLYTHPPKREDQRPMLGNTLIVVLHSLQRRPPLNLCSINATICLSLILIKWQRISGTDFWVCSKLRLSLCLFAGTFSPKNKTQRKQADRRGETTEQRTKSWNF